jgi:endoglucanase
VRALAAILLIGCGGAGGGPATPDGATSADGAPGADAPPATRLPYRGVNLSGAEFGSALPGTFGTDYIYPDPTYVPGYTSADYFMGKGMTMFRVNFMWERLQHAQQAALDATELTRLDTTVRHLTAKGAYVLLNPQNFARYYGETIGSANVPDSAFADFWSRLAAHFADDDHVLFGLVNEPHDLPTEQWRDAAQAAINAIRAAGAHNLITVPGNGWTGAHSWSDSDYGTPDSVVMLTITDPEDHFVFEVHQYLDSDFSGSNPTCQSSTIGADSLAGFTAWLRANGKQGLLAEFGGGSDATCLAAIDGMLAHVDANTDVYVGWSWWSAGPWWPSDYFLNLEPTASGDAPQMATLVSHLH